MTNYTLIYEDRWQSGSHWHCLTKWLRIQKSSEESWEQCAVRYNLDFGSVVIIYHDWPKMKGEVDEDVRVSEPIK